MKFKDFLIKNQIQEWKSYYIIFEALNGHLKTLRLLKQRLSFREGDVKINNFTEDEVHFIEDVDRHFLRAIQDQLLKFHLFVSYKMNFYLAPLLLKFVYNVRNYRERMNQDPEHEAVAGALRDELEKFYKELTMVKQYMALNFVIYDKLCRRYKREFDRINMFDPSSLERINQAFKEANVDSAYRKIDNYLKVVTTMYEENFFDSKQCKEAHRRLELIKNKEHLSPRESFYFGFFIGTFVICILLIATLLIETKFFDEAGSDFVTFMFPIFRGTLMLYLYWFLLGVDVYVWDRYNINFRRVFDIQRTMTSSAFQIMKRAFGFLAFWIIVFSYCALSNTQFFDSATIFNKVTSMYIAPVVWLAFFLYMLFPSTRIFNYEGRMMFFDQVWQVMKGPFSRIHTRTSWSMTQLLSFLIVLKDFLYTICYVNNVYDVGTISNNCFNADFKFMEFMIIFVICTWKNMFGVNKFIYLHKDRHKMSPEEFRHKRLGGIRGLSKGLIMTVLAIISFNLKKWPHMWYFWFVVTWILTFWSYRDDLVDDWGFLQTRDGLRSKLAYPKRRFYYFAIVFNLVLRLAWVVNLSPAVLTTTLSKNVVGLVLIILESLRSTVWNFFKMENDHLKYQGNFNFINSYAFPYDFEFDMSNPEIRINVSVQVRALLKNAFVRKDLFASNFDTDMNLSSVEPAIREKEVSRTARVSEIGFPFKAEKDHKGDLERLDESVTECSLFRAKAHALHLGSAKSKLTPDQMAGFMNKGPVNRQTAQSKVFNRFVSFRADKLAEAVEATLDPSREIEKGLVEHRG